MYLKGKEPEGEESWVTTRVKKIRQEAQGLCSGLGDTVSYGREAVNCESWLLQDSILLWSLQEAASSLNLTFPHLQNTRLTEEESAVEADKTVHRWLPVSLHPANHGQNHVWPWTFSQGRERLVFVCYWKVPFTKLDGELLAWMVYDLF